MAEEVSRNIAHPLFAISARRWIRLVTRNGGVDARYRGRAAFITVMSISTAPFRLLFALRYRRRIAQSAMVDSPVFIIGHWRSGTTYLHELMSQDPQFCHESMWQTMLPDCFLTMDPWKGFMAGFLPATRPMDQIEVAMDGPYEDEAALAVVTPWSFFHCLYFPRNAEEQYVKAIHFQGLSEDELRQWKRAYVAFIAAVSFANGGRRLLSKNPPNTARVRLLLELFPQAKFIFVMRDPYLVYQSTRKMRRNVLKVLALQEASEEELDREVMANYVRLLEAYEADKGLIPAGSLVEVRYEDLVADPKAEVRRIYESLGLPLDQALPGIQGYLDRQAKYKTNKYTMDDATVQKVDAAWGFAFERWKYPKRGDQR